MNGDICDLRNMIDNDLQERTQDQPASCIFEGYRALGLVTNHVPFMIKYGQNAEDLRIVTCVGRHFYTFDNKLALVEASHAHEYEISAMTHNERSVYTASNLDIFSYKHGHKKVGQIFRHHENKIKQMLILSDELISVDSENLLSIIDTSKNELISQIPFSKNNFEITVLFHPSTYINKILLGSEQGHLQLFNIRKQKCIYQYQGWDAAITCIEQSPVLDVVAIGLKNGYIHLHNLKLDRTLLSFKQDWGHVLRIAFRTDGPPVMVSTSDKGHMAIWDIENQRLLTQMRDIHDGPITGCEFVFQEAILITSSTDNSLKMWRFDQSDGKGELLRKLQGHTKPPTKIAFYSPTSHHIVSAAGDCSLRLFSVFTERANKSLGFASLNRKASKHFTNLNDPFRMEPIVNFDFKTTREKDFDNLVAVHQDSPLLTTWRIDHCKMGNHKLQNRKQLKFPNLIATSILVSNCGNFAIAGYNNGDILKFNIQSGLHRGSFKKVNVDKNGIKKLKNEKMPIVGLNCDQLCTILVSSQKNELTFWNFKTKVHINSIKFNCNIYKTKSNVDQNLIAVTLADNSFCIVDLETRSIIRKFDPLGSNINDIVFCNTSKWIICALSDCSLLVYDLISTELVDHFLLPSPCISLTMSHNGEFLATAHQGNKGIFVWANMTVYAPTYIRPLAANHKPRLLDLPIGRPEERLNQDDIDLKENDDEEIDDDIELKKNDEENYLEYKSPTQINDKLVTLSKVPASRWKNLIFLDIIKKRNQPKNPISKPENAPFFLPVASGIKPTLNIGQVKTEQPEESNKVINRLVFFSEFGQMLFETGITKNYVIILEYLKKLGPSAIDVEIRSLDSLPPASAGTNINEPILIKFFLEAILQRLQTNLDFELCNAYLSVLLKCHSDIIISNEDYSRLCSQILDLLNNQWNEVKASFNKTLCVLNYIRTSVI